MVVDRKGLWGKIWNFKNNFNLFSTKNIGLLKIRRFLGLKIFDNCMEKRMVKLIKTVESVKGAGGENMLVEYKKKVNEYKRKVKQANAVIEKLTNKLVVYTDPDYDEENIR
jgi:hypothetical protein